MLHLALAAFLAGSLGTGEIVAPAQGDDPAPRTEAAVGLFAAENDNEVIVNDTYAYGQPSASFLQLWAGYGWAQVDEYYTPSGGTVDGPELTAQRAFVGAQVNLINNPNFSFGVGGKLNLASNDVDGVGDSGFGMQGVKIYAQAMGSVLGVHGGYYIYTGDNPSAENPVTASGTNRDAIFVGANFDHLRTWLRLFGGIDYFMLQDNADVPGGTDDHHLVVFNMGAGVMISWVELGLAAIIHAQNEMPGAGHQGSIAPYLNLQPAALPVGISVRGALNSEFADYGLSLGGSNFKPVTNRGFTVALTYGF